MGNLKDSSSLLTALNPLRIKSSLPLISNFLLKRIKVEGKVGNLTDKVAVTSDANKIVVTATMAFSKRYLKYLTKKYLKKSELRDYLHVVASDKSTYVLKYFNVQQDEEEED